MLLGTLAGVAFAAVVLVFPAARLAFGSLPATVPDWREADVWFCGPPAFGRALKAALVAQGLPAADFHQELFEMR